MKDTLVIVGNYEKTRDLYNQKRTDADVWVFNEMLGRHEWIERADAVFQLHAEPIWRNPKNRTDPNHCHWLQTQTEVPVYMQDAYADVPRAVRYPLEAIIAHQLSNFNKRPFASTPAYALALAIEMGYRNIETYGIELGTDTEYFHQREGWCFWLGVAVGKGIKVTTYTDKLLNSPMYGYEGEVSIPIANYQARIDALTPPAQEMKAAFEKKAIDLKDLFANLRHGTAALNEAITSINELVTQAANFGIVDGALQENERWIDKANTMIETSGKYIFSRQEIESAKVSLKEKHQEMVLKATTEATMAGKITEAIVNEPDEERRADLLKHLAGSVQKYVDLTYNTAMMSGALAEDHAHLEWLDAHIRAAGGEKSVEALSEVQP